MVDIDVSYVPLESLIMNTLFIICAFAQIRTAWPQLQMAAFNSHATQATSCSTSTAFAAGTS